MKSLAVLFLVTVYTTVHCQDYCQMSCGTNMHTVCKRKDVNCGAGPSCVNFKAITFTDEDKRFITDLHNELRNRVATGKETIGNQPSASNMKALNYNSQLGYIAQCLTNSCEWGHDSCRKIESYGWVGQNIGSKGFSGTSGNYKSVLNDTIRGWYSEVQSFDASWVSSFRDYGKMVGHYTQCVWADTKEVGCGMTNYKSKDGWNTFYLACNYGGGGNINTLPVYKTGSPASACPAGLPVNSKYPGLCGADNIN